MIFSSLEKQKSGEMAACSVDMVASSTEHFFSSSLFSFLSRVDNVVEPYMIFPAQFLEWRLETSHINCRGMLKEKMGRNSSLLWDMYGRFENMEREEIDVNEKKTDLLLLVLILPGEVAHTCTFETQVLL